jgi:hypothetical protein
MIHSHAHFWLRCVSTCCLAFWNLSPLPPPQDVKRQQGDKKKPRRGADTDSSIRTGGQIV